MITRTGVVVAVAVVASASLWLVFRLYGGSGEHVYNFGRVAPNSHLRAVFAVANTSNSLMTLEGLDKACGLRARLDSNALVPPHQSVNLCLEASTSRQLGPGGSRFELGKRINGTVVTESFVLRWDVVSGPWLSKSEVWLDSDRPESQTIDIVAATPGIKADVISLPQGLSVRNGKESLEIRWQPPRDLPHFPTAALYGVMSLSLKGQPGGSFSIPIYLKPTSSPVFLYPSVSYLDSKEESIQVQLVGEAKQVATITCDSLVVSRHGSVLTLRRKAGPSAWVEVLAKDRGGAVVARSRVFVQ